MIHIEPELLKRVNAWLTPAFDKDTQLHIKDLIGTNPKELKESFYKDLEFGTGGMRGVMGIGTNRINKYTLGKNTQGLSDYMHKVFPNETLKEFSRLLKPGGTLILTAPSACLRHMDPYFFYSGFSDRWYEKFLADNGFEVQEISPVGDYYSWLGVEMHRTRKTHGIIAKVVLFPAFIYFFSKKKTRASIDTLCMGYHVLAKKREEN